MSIWRSIIQRDFLPHSWKFSVCDDSDSLRKKGFMVSWKKQGRECQRIRRILWTRNHRHRIRGGYDIKENIRRNLRRNIKSFSLRNIKIPLNMWSARGIHRRECTFPLWWRRSLIFWRSNRGRLDLMPHLDMVDIPEPCWNVWKARVICMRQMWTRKNPPRPENVWQSRVSGKISWQLNSRISVPLMRSRKKSGALILSWRILGYLPCRSTIQREVFLLKWTDLWI